MMCFIMSNTVSDIFNKSIVFLKVSEQNVCEDEDLVKPLRIWSYIDYATETRSMAYTSITVVHANMTTR